MPLSRVGSSSISAPMAGRRISPDHVVGRVPARGWCTGPMASGIAGSLGPPHCRGLALRRGPQRRLSRADPRGPGPGGGARRHRRAPGGAGALRLHPYGDDPRARSRPGGSTGRRAPRGPVLRSARSEGRAVREHPALDPAARRRDRPGRDSLHAAIGHVVRDQHARRARLCDPNTPAAESRRSPATAAPGGELPDGGECLGQEPRPGAPLLARAAALALRLSFGHAVDRASLGEEGGR